MTASGDLQTWGNDSTGQLANGATGTKTTVPAGVPPLAVDTAFTGLKPPVLTGGETHGARIKTSGVLETFGFSGFGALGQTAAQISAGQAAGSCDAMSPPDCDVPTPLLNTLPWLTVAAGETQTLAVRSDGTLWAWGNNGSGEVGNNSTAQQTVPVQIGTGNNWLKVFAGPDSQSSFAVKADGTLWAWGDNSSGQLGLNDANNRLVPTQVALSGEQWVDLAVGEEHTLGITADGKMWVWGHNGYGEIAQDPGKVSGVLVPSQIKTPSDTWLSVQGGDFVSSAIDAGGRVFGWGYDGDGEIGNGGTIGTFTPTSIGLSNVVHLCRTGTSALALDASSNLVGWGANFVGELGLGDETMRLSPVPAYTSELVYPVLMFACESSGTYLVDTTTDPWGSGDNGYGQEGLSVLTNSFLPQSGDPDTLFADNLDLTGVTFSASVNNQNAGNVNTLSASWSTSPTAQASKQWFQVALPGPTYFKQVSFEADSATTYPRSYQIQVSSDGTNWTTVASATGTEQFNTVDIPVQFASFVRIYLTGGASVPWGISILHVQY